MLLTATSAKAAHLIGAPALEDDKVAPTSAEAMHLDCAPAWEVEELAPAFAEALHSSGAPALDLEQDGIDYHNAQIELDLMRIPQCRPSVVRPL